MKALVLVSGGLDSATCLAMAVKEYGSTNVLALSVFYGQKHQKEIETAKKIVKYYNVQHKTLDLKALFEGSNCSLLEQSDEKIPHGTYSGQLESNSGKPVSTYVPFRNGLFLSCAASVALSKECRVIYYGAHSDDAAGNAYPDTSQSFNEAINSAIYIGSGNELKVEAPFINMTKAEVVKKGLELKVPYELTWSCYEGKEKACGVCGTCIDRLKAFELNNAKDPIEYAGRQKQICFDMED